MMHAVRLSSTPPMATIWRNDSPATWQSVPAQHTSVEARMNETMTPAPSLPKALRATMAVGRPVSVPSMPCRQKMTARMADPMMVARTISAMLRPAMSSAPIMMTGTQMEEPAHTKLVFHHACRSEAGTGTKASSSKTPPLGLGGVAGESEGLVAPMAGPFHRRDEAGWPRARRKTRRRRPQATIWDGLFI